MFYTYIIRSIAHPDQRYIGHTADLRQRLAKHNKGDVPHTSKFKLWKLDFVLHLKLSLKPVPAYLCQLPFMTIF